MVKRRTCIFISGKGSNLKNLISHSRDNNFPIKISLVICNNIKANGINYAKKNKVPYIFVDTKSKNYENKVLLNLKRYKITFICLAGFMKIISSKIIRIYNKKIINIHPSLLPKFKGLNTFSRMIKNREKNGGCTVHYVNNDLDSGKIIIQKKIKIFKHDNPQSLSLRVLKLEHEAYIEALEKII